MKTLQMMIKLAVLIYSRRVPSLAWEQDKHVYSLKDWFLYSDFIGVNYNPISKL
jgi:hypothetical protein